MRLGPTGWLLAGYASLLALLVRVGIDRQPYDDSYFFKRFALNLLDHGVFAWNVSDGPVYGNTSQLFQLIVAGVTSITRSHVVLAIRLLLALTLFAAFAISLHTSRRRGAALSTLLGFCSPVMLFTVLSGMETAIAFLLLAWLCAEVDPERADGRHWLVAPLLTVAVWLTRPDALLLAGSVVLGLRWLKERRIPWREALVIAALIATCLAIFRAYYGTALPLPFYAKQRSLSPYDPSFIALSDVAMRWRFSIFAWSALPLLLVALQRFDALNRILLGAVLVFEAYHLATTIDVMGMHGRFYAPALPVLIFAASRAEANARAARLGAGLYLAVVAVLVLTRQLPVGDLGNVDALTRAFYILGTLASTLFLTLWATRSRMLVSIPIFALSVLATCVSFHPRARVSFLSDDEYLWVHEAHSTVYRGLETLRACFGDAIDVYHSEVGVVGLRFQHGKVTDLAGLLSRDWLFRKQTFDSACQSEHPPAIFLPHRNYVALNQEIQRSACLLDYTRVIAESSSPLYVRSDLQPRYAACEAAVDVSVRR